MTKLSLTLAAGMILGGLGLTAASAAPAVPAPGLLAAETAAEPIAHRRMHHWRTHHRMYRRHVNRHRMRHGDPNARNPERPSYMQQRGTTSGGPRY
ncbi:hypothetical protein [Methylobacterium durans]|uniref:Uncharacterized protein n=1 Tax=Methylobacterium durans TaxID=2202825 RepID=A0A2U8WA08_9HYPH|nr:hypothetical protein [Methylobacterium durans]AWN42156.1 hypothetical protein DK389_18675 [Methylobacterium durans]